ncbi:MAG: IS1182 family transposase [Deltaproteobacteria bacterium]|nr:IS1182 family transposase [Deltaproteobacteria bacterium]
MAKYKHYDYAQNVLIPVSLEDQIVPGTLEFAIQTLVEERIDTSIFDKRYNNDETGCRAYDPKVLLKVVLFAYSRGVISSRKIERVCKENVTFMALACGQQPDHSTIATFVSSMKDEILPLYRDILLVCEEEDLLGGTFFAIDGSKLPSNASKQWSGRHSDLNRKKEKIEKKVEHLLKEQEEADQRDDDEQDGGSSGLSNRKRQVEKLQKQAGRIENFLKENDPKIGKQGKEIKSNITDNESANMMTSHGTIQGYNGQALVDKKHQVIVHAEAFGVGQDHHHIPPMLDGAKENMKEIGHEEDYFEDKILVADVNYHGPANLNKCEDEHLDAYIPDKNFRKRDPRFAAQERRSKKKSKRFTLEDFTHNEATDEYVCPEGKRLKLNVKKMILDGIVYRRYYADAEDCMKCGSKGRCIRGRKGKRRCLMVPIGHVAGNRTKEMAQKIDTEEGRNIYHQRIAIVEPVFANIKCMKRLDRFTLRGKIKVNIQWILYCMVHNMEKITNYGFT